MLIGCPVHAFGALDPLREEDLLSRARKYQKPCLTTDPNLHLLKSMEGCCCSYFAHDISEEEQ